MPAWLSVVTAALDAIDAATGSPRRRRREGTSRSSRCDVKETLRPRLRREEQPDRHEELVVPLDLRAPAEFVLRQHGLDGRGLGLAAPLRPRRRRRLALARRRLRVAHRDLRRRGQIRQRPRK